MNHSKRSRTLEFLPLTLLLFALIGLPRLTSRAQEQSDELQAVRERVFAGGELFRQ